MICHFEKGKIILVHKVTHWSYSAMSKLIITLASIIVKFEVLFGLLKGLSFQVYDKNVLGDKKIMNYSLQEKKPLL